MHLLATLQPADAPVLVHCPAGCGGGGVQEGEHGGFLAASLVCASARHATDEDGGMFRFRAVHSAAGSAAGLRSTSAETTPAAAFTLALHKRAGQARRDVGAMQELHSQLRDGLRAQAPAGGVAVRFFEAATAQPSRLRGDLVGEAAKDFDRLLLLRQGAGAGNQTREGLPGVALGTFCGAVEAAPEYARAARSAQSEWCAEESKTFARMDADGNGLLDLREYLEGFRAFEKTLSAVFARFDADGDGGISRTELALMQSQGRFVPMALIRFRQNIVVRSPRPPQQHGGSKGSHVPGLGPGLHSGL